MFRHFRKWFLSGLLLLAPIGVTFFAISFLMGKVATPARNVIFPGERVAELTRLQVWALDLVALGVVLTIVTVLGWLSSLVIGRWILTTFEKLIDSLPFVRTVYNTVKQIRDTFVQQQKAVFQKSVLIEYPRPGVWVLGFLTGTGKGEPQARTESDLVNVFVPTTPNPTSGFLLMVPAAEVKFLEMSISDGMKLIISGGAVVPEFPQKEVPEAAPKAPAKPIPGPTTVL
ncbi:MAG: DUF502 domain-containing protein [Opitutales bacterium]